LPVIIAENMEKSSPAPAQHGAAHRESGRFGPKLRRRLEPVAIGRRHYGCIVLKRSKKWEFLFDTYIFKDDICIILTKIRSGCGIPIDKNVFVI